MWTTECAANCSSVLDNRGRDNNGSVCGLIKEQQLMGAMKNSIQSSLLWLRWSATQTPFTFTNIHACKYAQCMQRLPPPSTHSPAHSVISEISLSSNPHGPYSHPQSVTSQHRYGNGLNFPLLCVYVHACAI